MKNKKKVILYIFFTIIIIVSAIVFYIDYQNKNKDPEIYDPLPSEIVVEDKDKKQTQIESALLNLAPDVDLNAERAKYNNNDIIGRLEIPDLFNVLVVKGTNNEYYLNHSVSKEYDIRGTEFMDFRNTISSQQINIYGHNTRDINIKVAFLKLEQFLNADFFNNNKYIVFQTDQGKSVYKILAMKEVHEYNREHMIIDKTGSDFVQHVTNMTTGEGVINSRNISYNQSSRIIVLQTCSHHWDNAFYTIIGVKVLDL